MACLVETLVIAGFVSELESPMKSTLAFFDVDRSYRNSRCFFQFSPGQAHTRGERAVTWEYKAMTLKDANVDSVHEDWEEKLNRVGAEG